MTTPNRPPLWEVIDKAWCAAEPFCDPLSNVQTACMIRAVRDWLLPEEPPPHRGMRPGGTNLTYQETLSVERQRLRALLTTEADRAS